MSRCAMAGCGLAAVLLSTPVQLEAEHAKNPHVWQPAVHSVAVFKNGMGFFLREGDVTLREDGWCVSGPVPPAAFGTLAIYAADEGPLVDVVGSGPGEVVVFDGQDAPADEATKRARLLAFRGLDVTLTSKRDDVEHGSTGRLAEVGPEFAILESNGQLPAVRLADLNRIQLHQYPLRIHVAHAPAAKPTRLGMAYLRSGITWVPEYTLRILDDQTAELTLRATLINEAEDLIHTDVHFVVGVPSFLHTDFLSPLAVGQAIRTVAAALPPGFEAQMVSNAIMQRAAAAEDQRPGTREIVVEPVPSATGGNVTAGLPQLAGAAGSDYTVYTMPDMTVRRGEKAMVTVFRHRVSYGHTYRWESPGEMKHYLVLHNDTETAWTTGPVVAVSDRRPLCQDIIEYTPRGSRHHLPVTTAINVATGASETEVDRKLKAHEPRHNEFFDLVTVDGRLCVENYEDRPVELTIRRTVPGRITSASDNGSIAQDTDRLKLIERQGWVTWKLMLSPDERRELTYRYERYVESR